MVTIRLARHGGKKKPFYHVTVAERSAKRDGRFIERVGFYNPVARGQEEELRIDLERLEYWLSTGAQPTDRVRQLVTRWRKTVAEQALAAASADAEPSVDAETSAADATSVDDETSAEPA
ncbi:MAG: 30S ribosomal protein S16 [Pseudomonadales bacterium]|nr:30S ribosomal protein S16 [Pseudomonadales bacterium]